MPASNTKLRVLEAASIVVEREGAAHLTIDAVAAEAGLSKGGVLYHFPNKHSLLEGMLNALLLETQVRVERHLPNQSKLHAWILAEQEQSASERSMALALLANAAEDPTLLEPARQFMHTTYADIQSQATDKDLCTTLFLAAEGLRFLNMLELLPFTEAERIRMHRHLSTLAKNGVV